MTLTHSEQINEIAAALAAAQGKMRAAARESHNPQVGRKYADLASVREACAGALSEAGVCVVQSPTTDEMDRIVVETMLVHASGQWFRGSFAVTVPTRYARGGRELPRDPQAEGTAITYARRYALAAMVGVAPAGDDDDGESAARIGRERAASGDGPAGPVLGPLADHVIGTGWRGRPVADAETPALERLRDALRKGADDPTNKWRRRNLAELAAIDVVLAQRAQQQRDGREAPAPDASILAGPGVGTPLAQATVEQLRQYVEMAMSMAERLEQQRAAPQRIETAWRHARAVQDALEAARADEAAAEEAAHDAHPDPAAYDDATLADDLEVKS